MHTGIPWLEYLDYLCSMIIASASWSWPTYIDKPSHCVTFIIGNGIHSDNFPVPTAKL